KSRTVSIVAAVLVYICVGCVWMGCGRNELDTARGWVVHQHRAKAGGRVGVLRALETADQAAALTRRLKRRGHPHCGGLPHGAFEATLTVELEMLLDGQEVPFARLMETRTVRRDVQGNLQVVVESDFNDPSGRSGEQRREERLVQDRLYVQEDNVPFVVHKAHHDTASVVLDRAMDAVPTMLMLADEGWTLTEEHPMEHTYTAGQRHGAELDCGAGSKGWLYRVLEHSRLSFGEATLGRGSFGWGQRAVSSRLLVEGERHMWVVRVDVDEKVQPTDHAAPITAPEVTAKVRRDRPYRDIEHILRGQQGLWLPHLPN
ncbi:MAG: hypothetical protein AAFS10_18285, partial [Myxococcota bacterium]